MSFPTGRAEQTQAQGWVGELHHPQTLQDPVPCLNRIFWTLFCRGKMGMCDQKEFRLVAYEMLRWVTQYTLWSVNIPGQPAQVKRMCGKHCFFLAIVDRRTVIFFCTVDCFWFNSVTDAYKQLMHIWLSTLFLAPMIPWANYGCDVWCIQRGVSFIHSYSCRQVSLESEYC